MTTFTIDDAPAILISAQPDWGRMETSYSIQTDVETGLSGREARTQRHAAMRLTLSYTVQLVDDELTEMRTILAERQGPRRLVAPLWMDMRRPSDYARERIHRTRYVLAWNGSSSWAILDTTAVNPSDLDYSWVMGCVVGWLPETCKLKNLTDRVAEMRIDIAEDSPIEYAVEPNEVNISTEWPSAIVPDWSRVNEQSVYEVTRSQIGYGREAALGHMESTVYRGIEVSVQLTPRSEILALIAHYHACGGSATVWTIPAWTGAGTQTGRYTTKPLKVRWITDALATAVIDLVETPWDGTITERMPRTAHLYRITYEAPTPAVWRYTDYEEEIDDGSETFTPALIEHGQIAETYLGEDGQTVEIVAAVWEGNPLLKFMPHSADVPMRIDIMRKQLEGAGATDVLWSGYIQTAKVRDRKITATATAFGGILDRAFPSVLIQRTDNAQLFTAANGLSAAAWQQTGTITMSAGVNLRVSGISSAAQYFTGGWLEAGDGEHFEVRPIVSHNGNMLRLHKPLRFAGVGDTIRVYPGYDGDISTARERFANEDNFLGFPFIPLENPTIVSTQTTQAGKK